MAPALSREKYLAALRQNLVDVHQCSLATFQILADTYNDEIDAMRVAGIAAVAPAKLLYAAWKIFHVGKQVESTCPSCAKDANVLERDQTGLFLQCSHCESHGPADAVSGQPV